MYILYMHMYVFILILSHCFGEDSSLLSEISRYCSFSHCFLYVVSVTFISFPPPPFSWVSDSMGQEPGDLPWLFKPQI